MPNQQNYAYGKELPGGLRSTYPYSLYRLPDITDVITTPKNSRIILYKRGLTRNNN